MSCTIGYLVRVNGQVRKSATWDNAWRGAMALWCHIAEVYLDPKAPPNTPKHLMPSNQLLFNDSVQSEVWALANDETQPRHLRIAQKVCFDRAILKRADFITAAESLEASHTQIGNTTFADQAAWLRQHATDKGVIGACWNVMSVAESHWEAPYNINRNTGHWFIEIPPVRLETTT